MANEAGDFKWMGDFDDFRCFVEFGAINQNFNAIIARVVQKQRSISAIYNPSKTIPPAPARVYESVKTLLLPIELLAVGTHHSISFVTRPTKKRASVISLKFPSLQENIFPGFI